MLTCCLCDEVANTEDPDQTTQRLTLVSSLGDWSEAYSFEIDQSEVLFGAWCLFLSTEKVLIHLRMYYCIQPTLSIKCDVKINLISKSHFIENK